MSDAENVVESPQENVQVIRRAAVTYGGRRRVSLLPDPDVTLVASSSSQDSSLVISSKWMDGEKLNLKADASDRGLPPSQSSEEHDELPHVLPWKLKMKELDRIFDEREESANDHPPNLDGEPVVLEEEPDFVPSAEKPADTAVSSATVDYSSDEYFGGSLPVLSSSLPASSFDESPEASPGVPRRAKGRPRNRIEDTDSEHEGGQSSSASPVKFPHPITTPVLHSPATPATSEVDTVIARPGHGPKGKGKATFRDVPPLQLDRDSAPNSPSQNKNGKDKRKAKTIRTKTKAPTKKERREIALEKVRTLSSRPVEITRTEDRSKHSISRVFELLQNDLKVDEPKLPSSDPIQPFTSSPVVQPEGGQPTATSGTQLVASPSPSLRVKVSSTIRQTVSLEESTSGSDDELPTFAQILSKDDDKRLKEESMRQLAEHKRRILAEQEKQGANTRDSGDELEVIDTKEDDMHDIVKVEARERKASKMAGSKPPRQSIPGRLPRTKSVVGHGKLAQPGIARLHASSKAAFTFEKKAGKAGAGIHSQQELNLFLMGQVDEEKMQHIRKKEEEWQRRGGRLIEHTANVEGSNPLGQRLMPYLEKGLQAQEARMADNAQGEDDEEQDSNDEDWEPELRGSASPPPMDVDGESGQESDAESTRTDNTDQDDEETKPILRRVPYRSKGPVRVIDSDDEAGPSQNAGRVLVPDTSMTEDDLSLHVTKGVVKHRTSSSSLDEQTEDENDKENNTRLMFDRSEDKENKAVVRHSPLLDRPLLSVRVESFSSLSSGIRRNLSLSFSTGNQDNSPITPQRKSPRSPLKELKDDQDPFSISSSSLRSSSFTARLQRAATISDEYASPDSPRASSSRQRFASPPLLRDRAGDLGSPTFCDENDENDSFKFKPMVLQPAFSQDPRSSNADTPSPLFAPVIPAAGHGVSGFFDNDENSSPQELMRPGDDVLTLDVVVRPPLDISATLKQKANAVFDKEQGLAVEAANQKFKQKDAFYINDHGFLTQSVPLATNPVLYRAGPYSQISAPLNTPTQLVGNAVASSSKRTPLRTLSFVETRESSPSVQPLQRLRRRSITPPLDDARLSRHTPEPPASPTHRIHKPNAYDVLLRGPQHKGKQAKLGKSEFVEAEAVEDDEDDMLLGFGLGSKPNDDDSEEEDDENQDKNLEGLVDDAPMDEETQAEELVLEKVKEHREEDDREIEKIHRDAIEGKLRTKRRGRGVGFDSDTDDDDEDDKARRIRNAMSKKRKIDGDGLEALGQNEETRPFFDAYQQDLVDDDDDFPHLQHDDAKAMMEDQEDGEDKPGVISVSEFQEKVRDTARNNQSFEAIDPHDVSWVDEGDKDEGASAVAVKVVSVQNAKAGVRINAGPLELDIEHTRHQMTEQEKVKMSLWAKSQSAVRNRGTGRSAAGAAVTGHNRTKVKSGGGSLRTQQILPGADQGSSSGATSKRLGKSTLLAKVPDRSSRFR